MPGLCLALQQAYLMYARINAPGTLLVAMLVSCRETVRACVNSHSMTHTSYLIGNVSIQLSAFILVSDLKNAPSFLPTGASGPKTPTAAILCFHTRSFVLHTN